VKTADLVVDTNDLYEAVSRRRRRLGLSRQAVMTEVGTVSSTLTRLGQGYTPNANTLLRICTWLGRDLRDFTKKSGGESYPNDRAPAR
jgi:transcriptional regulator with XRE-family HTH domain